MSHLLQMRGLKHTFDKIKEAAEYVASFTDAWIETKSLTLNSSRVRSHLLQMRGLKHSREQYLKSRVESHLLQMRGLKLLMMLVMKLLPCRIFYRCVD